MTDAADIRRAVERDGLRGFARRCGCPVAAVQRLVKRGAYPERGPHGEAMRAAVVEGLAESEAEPAASPEAGGGPAVPEVPERFAATLRFLAGAPVPEDFDRMAFIQSWMWQLRNAVERDGPRLMAAPNDDPDLDRFLVKVALETLARDCDYELGPVSLTPLEAP